MSLLDILSNFLSSNESKALIESNISTSKEDASSRQAGTGQTGRIVNKGKSTAKVDNSTTNNYTFNFNLSENQATEKFKQQLIESFRRGEIQFLRDDSEKDITGYNKFEQDESVQELIRFFSDKISPEDILVMRAGLYVQYLNNVGDFDQAIRIKDHVNKDRRSRNIINLASAGYFQSYIRPIFENNDSETATAEYNDIVRFMPETIFVNNNMTPNDIVVEISDKITEKEQYHMTVSKIITNGIGQQCVQNIKEAEVIIHKKYPNFPTTTEVKNVGNITYAKMQINLPS